jgi:hypothetical protein
MSHWFGPSTTGRNREIAGQLIRVLQVATLPTPNRSLFPVRRFSGDQVLQLGNRWKGSKKIGQGIKWDRRARVAIGCPCTGVSNRLDGTLRGPPA